MSACALPHGFQPMHNLALYKHASPHPLSPQRQRDRSVVVLGDNLHYPECVVRLEILVLCVWEKLIPCKNVGDIWARLERNDQIVVKSTHRMLAKMARSLSSEQLGELFQHIKVKGMGREVEED